MKAGIFLEGKAFSSAIDRDIGVGDDALPYVGDSLISVADGASSRGGKRVKELDPRLTDAECAFDVMLEGCEVPERYREQFNANFHQLFELGFEEYVGMGGRRSSYFGSRLATILLRQIVEEEEFPRDALAERFDALSALQGAELEEALEALERRMARKLRDRMRRAARNGGIRFLEQADSVNANLMCTTYSGIVFYEEADCVHTLSIQAGDSMLWAGVSAESDVQGQPWLALRQLLPVQERSDSGLKNTVNIDSDFYLRCAYHRIPKPCFALVASDGCFDFFDTQILFEHFLMSYLMRGKSLEDACAQMEDYLGGRNTGDDSSTMAIAAFGFDNYDQLAQRANRRRGFLWDHYELDNADLYSREETPEARLQCARMDRIRVLKEHVDDMLNASPWLQEKAVALGEREFPTRLHALLDAAQRQGDAAKEGIRQAREDLEKRVRAEWLDIRQDYLVGLSRKGFGMGIGRRQEDIYELQRRRRQRRERLEPLQSDIADCLRRMGSLADRLSLGTEQSDDDVIRSADTFGGSFKGEKKKLTHLIDELENNIDELDGLRTKLEDQRRSILKEEREDIARCVAELCGKQVLPERWIHLSANASRQLNAALEEVFRHQRQRAEAEAALESGRNAFARQILQAKPALLLECYEQHRNELTHEAAQGLNAAMHDVERAFADAEALEKRRQQHMQAYEAEALSIMMQRS